MTRWLLPFLLAGTTAAAHTSGPARAATDTPGFGVPAAAVQRPCLTPAEAKSLATFVLPGLVQGVARRCRGTLARDAFLRGDPTRALVDRLRRDATPDWPVAKQAIEKLNGGERLPGLLGERFIMGVAESTAADMTLRRFDTADCGTVDALVAGLAPLPSSNLSDVVASLIALGGDRIGDDAQLRICPAAATAATR